MWEMATQLLSRKQFEPLRIGMNLKLILVWSSSDKFLSNFRLIMLSSTACQSLIMLLKRKSIERNYFICTYQLNTIPMIVIHIQNPKHFEKSRNSEKPFPDKNLR
jgi:hypothetical protein